MTTTLTDVAAAWSAHVGTDAAPAGVLPQPREALADIDAVVDVVAEPAVVAPEIPTQRQPALDEVAAAVALLWSTFKGEGCPDARQRLILHYAPLVAAVAGRVGMRLPSTVEHGDLVSYGMFGLIDAIEKYETDRAVKFESYASSRIRGAIIDELRAMDWVPRSVRTKARAVDRAYTELECTLHRAPTELEIARHMQVPVAELRSVYSQLSSVNVAALDELLNGGEDRVGGVSLGDTLGDDRMQDPAGTVEAAETSFLLGRAIEQLGERERIVVVMYYYEGMTLAEIGRVLGVTESRVSQMHTAAMLRLRGRLTAAGV
ncbi:FliA/WhiG family RNA polymerase sigma factor [Cellulomonas edaphi]|uniref:RNA polymerase sigma factor n=1 Tax=Cellulomonas edaphi TaxID=3053468 RepID=A0ABT7SAV3_9CELL|nr:FliA/WhiG family RNA polymerase sigma factor [Cellulomons edaphi]MDM7832701.1 FliA/WhiG family RNA polymerase sigma factor [Cellulomons edaphi]